MTNPPNRLTSLLHPRGVVGPVRVRAFTGSGLPKTTQGTRAPARTPFFALLLSLLSLTALVAASPALAEQKRIFTGSFGCTEGAAGCTTPDPYPLAYNINSPGGVAVDQATGDVYVADGVSHVVEKFSPSGEFILMFGREVNRTKVAGGVATEAEQNVCTEEEVAISAVECQVGASGEGPGEFVTPISVAVAIEGDVYVADRGDGLVTKLEEAQEGKLLQPVEAWGDNGPGEAPNGQLKAAGASGAGLGENDAIALDGAGNLWVSGVSEFTSLGKPVPAHSWSPIEEGGGGVGAVDGEDNVYLDGINTVEKYSSTGTFIGDFTNGSKNVKVHGFTVDSSGTFYADTVSGFLEKREESKIDVYAGCRPTFISGELQVCTPTGSFGANHPTDGALAVDSATATLYAVAPGGQIFAFSEVTVPALAAVRPSSVTSSSATLEATVDPAGVELQECFFEWGETASYGNRAPCVESPAQIGSGTSEVAVRSAPIPGLTQGRTYHYRLVAFNANDVHEPQLGPDVAFGPPLIDDESNASVAATSATVGAEISPQALDTRFEVQYGTSTGYGLQSPQTDLGAGLGVEGVSVSLVGLAPDTVYHYRLAAENVFGTAPVDGPDRTFTTQGAGAFALPDGRRWEMVSPPQKEGALIEPIGGPSDGGAGAELQAAANGDAITYVADAPTEAEPQGNSNFVQVLSTRGASGGWSSRDIAAPHTTYTGLSVGGGQEDRFFSEDLSRAVLQPFGAFEPSLSEEASEQTPFLRSDYLNGDVEERCLPETMHCYQPLVTGKKGYANVPAGTVFGQGESGTPCINSLVCGPSFVGGTPNLSHVVLESEVALTGTAGVKLYEWSAGKPAGTPLQPVSILPDGDPATDVEGVAEGTLGSAKMQARHAISEDGSRVFWTYEDQLYMRDVATEKTLKIGGSSRQEFQAANREGSTVLFTEGTGSVGKVEGGNLWECRIEEEPGGELKCALTDITPSGGVQELVLGASEDASWVYYVAGGPDLYVAHDSGGVWTTKLVAALSQADRNAWRGEGEGQATARVSPNGEWLAFMSQRSLTGYDNRDALSGQPDQEVYLYHAPQDLASEPGALACASCDPTGARPHGVRYYRENEETVADLPLVGGDRVYEGSTWLAANVPTWVPYRLDAVLYQPRYLSSSGRLFFDSSDALVPQDVNGTEDVYEYEPEGVPAGEHACSSASASGSEVFKPGGVVEVEARQVREGAGCVALISSGESPQESAFLDASENGSDVFFLTTAQLAPQDTDNALDVYDAQECTVAAPCQASAERSPACTTEASCRPASPPQPSIFGLSGSATFSGAGNLAPPGGGASNPPKKVTKKTVKCKRPKKLSHGKCVKSRKKTKARKSAHTNRRVK